MGNSLISVIVPTLNEESRLAFLLASLGDQTFTEFEVVIVDGGSKDKTVEMAKKHKANVLIAPSCGEFVSRNIGANSARGEILLFTSADVRLPTNFLERIHEKFVKDSHILALFGPHLLDGAPLVGKVEYYLYNLLRYVFSKLPRPFTRFSISTNFLAVKKETFEKFGGFDPFDINADGLFGQSLSNMGEVKFYFDTYVFVSARRMRKMGFLGFNFHYLYVLENFLPLLSKTRLIKLVKQKSKERHHMIH